MQKMTSYEAAEKVVVLKGRGFSRAVSNLFYSATLVAEGIFPRMTEFFSILLYTRFSWPRHRDRPKIPRSEWG
jgi:hypothetical protein